MRSRILINLDKRYWYLRCKYLPKNFSKTGTYSNEQYTDAIAFRVLFHAELETYLEAVALSILSQIISLSNKEKYCRASSALMTIFKTEKMHGFPTQKDEFKDKSFFKRTLDACAAEMRRRVENNKGVRAPNLLAMFLPIGLDETELDEQLLIDLSTFGSQRGDVAHKALSAIVNLPDPKEEKILAERIILALSDFEKCVSKALS